MSSESLLARMICNRARVSSLKYRVGELDKQERERVQRMLFDISQMTLYIDDCAATTMPLIREKLLALRARRGLGLVVIDYLQLMASDRRENRNQEVSALSRGLKVMAREFRVPFL